MNNIASLEPKILSRHAISAEQLGIWYIQRLEPTCSAYNMVVAFDVKVNQPLGNKPMEILEAVLHDYPLLRVSMPANDQGIEQIIWDRVYPNIILSDARHVEASDLTKLVEQDTKQPFDLTQPPLWRIHCYERGQNHYVIAVVIHHALMDFWSIGLLLRDVCKRFGLVTESNVVNGIEFAQYADKQKSNVIGDADESLLFWKNALKHAPHVHSIPLDYPRPAVQQHKGSSVIFRVPESVSSGLVNLAKDYEITLFGLVLSGFYILLNKLSNENNLVVATAVAGRLERSLRNALGQFVNTIALNIDIDADQTLRQFTQQVQEQLKQSLKHQKVAFSRVVEAVSPKRDGSINPLAQVGMFWERLGGLDEFKELLLPIQNPATLAGQDLTLGSFPVRQQEGQLDIMLEMGGEYQGELVGVLKYNSEIFSAESAENMVQLLQVVLSEMVAHPERKIVELDIAPDYANGIQLGYLPGQVTDYPRHDLLGMILKQIDERGDNHAMTSRDHAVSYHELGQHIAGIAEYLRAHGITNGDRVGLMVDRTVLLPAAVLGIWAAGAAYVPLDPSFPRERLHNIVEDAEPKVILTQTDLMDALTVSVPRRPYFSRWIDRLVLTRFGRMQAPTPNCFSYQNRYWIEIYTKQPVGSEKSSALFLHGIPFDSTCWLPIINKITYDQVAMMDLPGLGRSGSYEVMEDNNHQFIDNAAKLLAPNSVVIAHSLGCLFALSLAQKYPNKVARLILISPYFVQAQAAKIFQIQTISNLIFRFVSKDKIAKNLHPDGQKNLSVGYAMDSLHRVSVAKHISEYMHRISLPQQRVSQTALLNELGSKVEIIVGEKDPIVTTISPNIPVHIIAGAGHNPHVTHVEAVYDYLTPVLTKYISTTVQLSDV
ncbi:alpha/beta fold hydrolase [Acinetobacter pittii]|uniref:alpha/beta fold hydrolase n=7 Tax=Acinetobacter TaxID=469 RepID=UPI000F73E8FA|nr:alpha/beta fold hydrolase [Acinetobacter pittii]RSO84782.1 alpha/beta fold hydrolase [Acinetobacter pittii]